VDGVALGASRPPGPPVGSREHERRHSLEAGEALGEEGDVAVREGLGEVRQGVADAEVGVVQFDFGEAAERHPGGGVGHAAPQLDRTGPVVDAGRCLLEAGPAVPYVLELHGERAGRVPLDVGVPGLGTRIHRAAGEDVDESVGVAGEVRQHMAMGPAGQQGRLGDGGVLQFRGRGEEPLGRFTYQAQVAYGIDHKTDPSARHSFG
jgi:hypothetical protein